MKVLLISPLPPPVGGIASWTVNLTDYLKNCQKDVELVLINSNIIGKSITSESKFKRITSGVRNFFRIYTLVRKSIKETKPCVIHLVTSSSLALFKDYIILCLARKENLPIIIHWRFGRIPWLVVSRNWEWKMLSLVIQKSTKSIVIDAKSYETLVTAGYTNIINIPNPIAMDVEQKAKAIIRKTYHRQQGRVVFVGHIIRNKGVFELVEACTHLPVIKQLMLIGPYEENIKNELLKIAGKKEDGIWLNFAGVLIKDEVLEQMYTSPILAIPSFTEGFPNAILEGMAMGCAVIATDVGAIPEMLDIQSNKPCGICVPPHNVEKLKEAILELLQNPSKTEMIGKNGIHRVLNNYSIEKITECYKSVWNDVLNDSSLL